MTDPIIERAALILIGDELLNGKVDDRNGPYLIRSLRELGVALREVHMVGDTPTLIAEMINMTRHRNDVVVTSGGVGPTHDDTTMDGLSMAFDAPLTLFPELETLIVSVHGQDSAWLKTAWLPQGCELVTGPHSPWPCYRMANVYVLPGSPSLFQSHVDHLRERWQGAPFFAATLFVTLDEGALADTLSQGARRFRDVALGSYPELNAPDYRVRITLESRDHGRVHAALQWLRTQLPDTSIVHLQGPSKGVPNGA